ncbi:hypothetical protein WA158_004524 [Blastocystis sp. Blastoise]
MMQVLHYFNYHEHNFTTFSGSLNNSVHVVYNYTRPTYQGSKTLEGAISLSSLRKTFSFKELKKSLVECSKLFKDETMDRWNSRLIPFFQKWAPPTLNSLMMIFCRIFTVRNFIIISALWFVYIYFLDIEKYKTRILFNSYHPYHHFICWSCYYLYKILYYFFYPLCSVSFCDKFYVYHCLYDDIYAKYNTAEEKEKENEWFIHTTKYHDTVPPFIPYFLRRVKELYSWLFQIITFQTRDAPPFTIMYENVMEDYY